MALLIELVIAGVVAAAVIVIVKGVGTGLAMSRRLPYDPGKHAGVARPAPGSEAPPPPAG